MLGGVSDTYRSGPSGSGVDQAVGMQLAGSSARSYSLLSKGALATHGQDSLSMNKRVKSSLRTQAMLWLPPYSLPGMTCGERHRQLLSTIK